MLKVMIAVYDADSTPEPNCVRLTANPIGRFQPRRCQWKGTYT
jgi:hypothetical protein